MTPRILVFAASTRKGSFNRRLCEVVARRLKQRGTEVTQLDLSDYPLPMYDADLEAEAGIPKAATALHEQLRGHHGVVIASPEYNANASPLLLNILAWVSRVTDHGGMASAFGKPVYALCSASPGGFGGYRGLMALRTSLELQMQARVLPLMVPVPMATEAFDASGELANPRSAGMLNQLLDQLVREGAKVELETPRA